MTDTPNCLAGHAHTGFYLAACNVIGAAETGSLHVAQPRQTRHLSLVLHISYSQLRPVGI